MLKKILLALPLLVSTPAMAYDIHIQYSTIQETVDKKLPMDLMLGMAHIESLTIKPYKDNILEITVKGSYKNDLPFTAIAHSSIRYDENKKAFYLDDMKDIIINKNGKERKLFVTNMTTKERLFINIIKNIPIYHLNDTMKQTLAKHLLHTITVNKEDIVADMELF